MTVLEIRDVLSGLVAKSADITSFEAEILFKILVAHTGQQYSTISPKHFGTLSILLALKTVAGSLSRGDVKSCYRISIEHGKCPLCAGCQTEIKSITDFSWDHDHPKCYGGPDSVSNMKPMHRWCNNFKGNKLIKISAEAYLSHMIQVQNDINSEKKKQSHEAKIKKDYYPKRRHVRINGWCDLTSFMNRYTY